MYINRSYKDLIVWQKSIELVAAIYQLTDNFPKHELFGLTSQMRRAAISIPSNIAEGKMRGGDNEFKRFLYISYASGAELETQIIISKKLMFIADNDFQKVDLLLEEVMKMLNKLINNKVQKQEPSA